jgi:hypothetical protein
VFWDEGSTGLHAKWNPDQPSGDGNCLSYCSGKGWNDIGCDEPWYFICEEY